MKRFIATLALCALSGGMAWATSPQDSGFDSPRSEGAEAQGQAPTGPPQNAMFSVIDANGDGAITMRELRKAVAALKKLDSDGDGVITLAEVSQPAGPADESTQFVDRLMANDRNGDGKLTADEVDARTAAMLQGADANGDGAIDRQELAAAAVNARNGGAGGFTGQFGATQVNSGRLMDHDRNGDGKLTPDEVPPNMSGLIRGGDQNNDGALDAQELRLIQMRMQSKHGRGPAGQPDFPGRKFGQEQNQQP